jgi:hypothetical protein
MQGWRNEKYVQNSGKKYSANSYLRWMKTKSLKKHITQRITSADMKMAVFCDVALCTVVEIDRRFRGAYCLLHQSRRENLKYELANMVRVTEENRLRRKMQISHVGRVRNIYINMV